MGTLPSFCWPHGIWERHLCSRASLFQSETLGQSRLRGTGAVNCLRPCSVLCGVLCNCLRPCSVLATSLQRPASCPASNALSSILCSVQRALELSKSSAARVGLWASSVQFGVVSRVQAPACTIPSSHQPPVKCESAMM